jgi:ribosomal protein S16
MRTKIIRLRRRGAIRAPFFEIIVTFKDRRSNGSGLEEKLGYINFTNSNRIIVINCERLGILLNKGVILHKSVKYYLSKLALENKYDN